MSNTDLTRWNRAGLTRFRYIDANAATHLERLRLELAERFAQWQALQYEPPHAETVAERTERIVKQYRAERRDWAWETTRAFARALHIQTEHMDAFANEGYLRTATQWQSVRRLAAMVAYTPAPASSATTPLVLIAKSEVERATVKRGFAIKHVPAEAPPVIFETLEDIDIAAELNALRLKDWNVNATRFAPYSTSGTPTSWPIPKDVKVSAGGLAILVDTKTDYPYPVKIQSVTEATSLTLAPLDSGAPALTVDTALLHVSPSQILVPFLNGTDVVRVSSPHDFVAGDVAAWKPGGAGGSTTFAKVLAADSATLRLEGATPPTTGNLYKANFIPLSQFIANSNEWRLPHDSQRTGDFRLTFASAGTLVPSISLITANWEEGNDPITHVTGFLKLKGPDFIGANQLWFADPAKDKPAATVQSDLLPDKTKTLEFDGKPPALASGDLVILQTASGYAANRIKTIEKDAGRYRLVFATAFTGSVTAVHASFAASLRPDGYHFNPDAVRLDELTLDLTGDGEWTALLHGGRQLVLESASDALNPIPARIVSVERIASANPLQWKIRIDRSTADFPSISRGDLIVRANVVDAGHGETKPVRVLGSGDAAATNQRFAIDVDDVSHVRDIAMPGGVRADVVVEAEREIYSQVATLRDSEPADPHYVARTTDAGTLELEFGDGRDGRRLPSGSNNVLATIRRGSGLGGNLAPWALTDIVKKHPAVDTFLQPIAASGGDDREAIDQIRQGAPGRLAAMDRAISVSDYQRLAQRFQGVWHAAAFEKPSFGRSREAVRVVIVPAGGGALGPLGEELRSYLVANGLPSVDIVIEAFAPLAAEIHVDARVDSTRFDPREVEGRVRAGVLAAFDLRLRRPGQPLYRSEVTRVVENTDGVSNSDVKLFTSVLPAATPPDWGDVTRGDDDGIWAAFPKDNRVIYAADPTVITVTTAEATI